MTTYQEYQLETLPEMARRLSSGTMASLTGLRTYAEVDPIQFEFTEFCEENVQRFATWQPAWNEYWRRKNT